MAKWGSTLGTPALGPEFISQHPRKSQAHLCRPPLQEGATCILTAHQKTWLSFLLERDKERSMFIIINYYYSCCYCYYYYSEPTWKSSYNLQSCSPQLVSRSLYLWTSSKFWNPPKENNNSSGHGDTLVISAFVRPKQASHEFKASLGSMVSIYLKNYKMSKTEDILLSSRILGSPRFRC